MTHQYLSSNGFIVFNDKLQKFEFESVTINLGTGEVLYMAKVGGVDTLINHHPRVYRTEEAFRMCEPIDLGIVDNWRFPAELRIVGSDYKVIEWIAGEPRDVIFTGDIVLCKGESRFKFADTSRRIYRTTDDAFKYNDYVKVDDTGNETLVKCIANRVVFSDEQQNAINVLKDAIEKARATGVNLFYDASFSNLRALPFGTQLIGFGEEPDGGERVDEFAQDITALDALYDDQRLMIDINDK